jgi:hypothetical protein
LKRGLKARAGDRLDQQFKGVLNLFVFLIKEFGSFRRQIAFTHKVGDQFPVGAIRDAPSVESPLCGRAVLSSIVLMRAAVARSQLFGLVRESRARHHPASPGITQLKQNIGRYLIGCVFLAPQYRQPQQVEQGVCCLVQGDFDQGADYRVNRLNAGHARFFRHVLPQTGDQFVAKRTHR